MIADRSISILIFTMVLVVSPLIGFAENETEKFAAKLGIELPGASESSQKLTLLEELGTTLPAVERLLELKSPTAGDREEAQAIGERLALLTMEQISWVEENLNENLAGNLSYNASSFLVLPNKLIHKEDVFAELIKLKIAVAQRPSHPLTYSLYELVITLGKSRPEVLRQVVGLASERPPSGNQELLGRIAEMALDLGSADGESFRDNRGCFEDGRP